MMVHHHCYDTPGITHITWVISYCLARICGMHDHREPVERNDYSRCHFYHVSKLSPGPGQLLYTSIMYTTLTFNPSHGNCHLCAFEISSQRVLCCLVTLDFNPQCSSERTKRWKHQATIPFINIDSRPTETNLKCYMLHLR